MDRSSRRAELRRMRKESGSEGGLTRRLITRLDPRRPELRRRGKEQSELEQGSIDCLVTVRDSNDAASEAYRGLRTNLLYAFVDNPPKVIVTTSPSPGEGKSTTCANLAVVLAQAAKNTLLLDCDLRKPVVHNIFGMRNRHGIVDVIVGERRLQEVWNEPLEGLKVVSAGPLSPNPTEILGSRRFSKFLGAVREEFDYVLLDTSPIGLVSDPAVLATQGDGVLLVLDAQNTRKGAIRQAMRSLEAIGANVLGTVMNNADVPNVDYYYGYTY